MEEDLARAISAPTGTRQSVVARVPASCWIRAVSLRKRRRQVHRRWRHRPTAVRGGVVPSDMEEAVVGATAGGVPLVSCYRNSSNKIQARQVEIGVNDRRDAGSLMKRSLSRTCLPSTMHDTALCLVYMICMHCTDHPGALTSYSFCISKARSHVSIAP